MVPDLHRLSLPASETREAHDLAYAIWGLGSDKPTLVCVHGLTRNGRDFDFLAQAMCGGISEQGEAHSGGERSDGGVPPHYQVLCPDMPGRGKSDWLKNTQHYTQDTYLADTLALLEHHGISQVDWVGTSMGGILGMRIAAERPGIIRKLVLNDLGAVIPLAGLERINRYVGITPNFPSREAADAYLRTTFASFGITREEHWQHMLEHSFTRTENGEYQLAYDPGILDPMRDAAKNLAFQADTLLWPWWDQITCPVLVIRGEQSDILTTETVEEMVHRHPETSALTIPKVGHAPSLMEEDQIQAIREWLTKAL